MIDETLLARLMEVEAATGDEHRLTQLLREEVESRLPSALIVRLGNSLIVSKGRPRVAVFAHIDSVGFTLGYGNTFIAIGGPTVDGPTRVRCSHNGQTLRAVLEPVEDDYREFTLVEGGGDPGTRWVYDTRPTFDDHRLNGAFLDNRFGVYNALHQLEQAEDVLVAFTAGEEQSGRGAMDCGRWVYENTDIRRALISDITYATDHIHAGRGPVVSLRDAFLPRTEYVDRCRDIAEKAGIPYQLEIEAHGGSDGGMLERSGFGIDWCFVGAPENGYHSAHESLARSDAENMLRLYARLIPELSKE